jgi:hypothetical protein
MVKILASFEEAQAEAAIEELSRLNIEGADWRVYRPGDDIGRRGVLAAPNTSGSGARAADGGAVGLFGIFGGRDSELGEPGTSSEKGGYIDQILDRGGVVLVVDVPDEHETAIRYLLDRHDASNVTKAA